MKTKKKKVVGDPGWTEINGKNVGKVDVKPEFFYADGTPITNLEDIETERKMREAAGPRACETESKKETEVHVASAVNNLTKLLSEEKPPSILDYVVETSMFLIRLARLQFAQLKEKTNFSTSIAIGDFSASMSSKKAERLPQKARSWINSFTDEEVEPGNTVSLCFQPQCYFRVRKLVALGDLEGLTLSGALVGQRLQFPATNRGIPLAAFAPGVLNDYSFDTSPPAFSICVMVHNNTDTKKKFSIILSGEAVI